MAAGRYVLCCIEPRSEYFYSFDLTNISYFSCFVRVVAQH